MPGDAGVRSRGSHLADHLIFFDFAARVWHGDVDVHCGRQAADDASIIEGQIALGLFGRKAAFHRLATYPICGTISSRMEVIMTKSAMIRARVDPSLKEEAENVFEALGLSATQAITLFYQQVKWYRGLPFEVRVPNEVTLKTFEETDTGQNLVRFENAQDMFAQLGI